MTDRTLSDVTWVTAVLRRHTPLFLSIHVSGQTLESIRRQTGLPVGFTHLRRSGLALQYSQEELTAARRVIHQQAMNLGLPFFQDFSRLCKSSCETLLQVAEKASVQFRHQQSRSQCSDGPALEALLRPYFDAAIAQASLLVRWLPFNASWNHSSIVS